MLVSSLIGTVKRCEDFYLQLRKNEKKKKTKKPYKVDLYRVLCGQVMHTAAYALS